MTLACLDGQLLDVEEARIPVTDEGLLRGDGVFEVARLYGGRPYALDEHLDRMANSAANLRLPFDIDALRADAHALLDAEDAGDALIRLVVTRGGRRISLIEPLPALPPSMTLGYVVYLPSRVLDGIKSLSYGGNMLATRLAKERGFDEALLVTPHDRVLEAPTSSFFWAREGQLYTAPLEDHVLDSITRRRLFELTDVQERPTTKEDLLTADEAFLASSLREVVPVSTIEGHELPGGSPLAAAAGEALRARIQADIAAAAT
jgi:branched-chain amino acid aminotransferase